MSVVYDKPVTRKDVIDAYNVLRSDIIRNYANPTEAFWEENYMYLFRDLKYCFHLFRWEIYTNATLFTYYKAFFEKFPDCFPRNVDWQSVFNKWKDSEEQRKVVNAIIFSRKLRHFLVVKGFYLDKWMFPGGKVRFNETDEEGVIREVKEETGLNIKHLMNKIVSFETKGEKRSFRTFIVEGIKFTQGMKPEKIWEVEKIKWIPTHNIQNILTEEFSFIESLTRGISKYVTARKDNKTQQQALRDNDIWLNPETTLPSPHPFYNKTRNKF